MSLCYLPWCIACYCRSHLRLCFFCGHLETSLYIISLEYVQSYSPMLKGDQPVLIKRIQRPCHCWLSQHLFTASTKVQNFMLSRLILLMVYDNSMQLFFFFFYQSSFVAIARGPLELGRCCNPSRKHQMVFCLKKLKLFSTGPCVELEAHNYWSEVVVGLVGRGRLHFGALLTKGKLGRFCMFTYYRYIQCTRIVVFRRVAYEISIHYYHNKHQTLTANCITSPLFVVACPCRCR